MRYTFIIPKGVDMDKVNEMTKFIEDNDIRIRDNEFHAMYEALHVDYMKFAREMSVLPRVKQPTNMIRKEYPYCKRLLRALLAKPTWYEVNEWISPIFNDTKGDEIKVEVMKYK